MILCMLGLGQTFDFHLINSQHILAQVHIYPRIVEHGVRLDVGDVIAICKYTPG